MCETVLAFRKILAYYKIQFVTLQDLRRQRGDEVAKNETFTTKTGEGLVEVRQKKSLVSKNNEC